MLDELSIFITTVLNRGIKKFINKNAKVDFELTKLKNAKVLEYYLKLPKNYIDKDFKRNSNFKDLLEKAIYEEINSNLSIGTINTYFIRFDKSIADKNIDGNLVFLFTIYYSNNI